MQRPPFRFELESVLRVREQATERARDAAAQSAADVARQSTLIAALEERLLTQIEEGMTTPDSDSLMSLRRSSARQTQMRARIEMEGTKLKTLTDQQELVRKRLLACRMKEEAVLKLREQSYERYKREMEQAENALADELVQMATARSIQGNK